MKRIAIALSLLAALAAGVWLFLREEGGTAAATAPEAAGEAASRPHAQGGSTTAFELGGASGHAGLAAGALGEAVAQSGAPGSTPPLVPPPTAADGFVEVQVLAQGKPFESAKVRLYRRGERDRAGQIAWRLAGIAQTDGTGKARIAAPAGSYLVTARGAPFAPAHHELARPSGEPVTKVTLELTAGLSLAGRTVQRSAKQEAVALAQVTLSYDAAPAPGRGRRMGIGRTPADAPVEEESRATSDEQGRFHFDGLEAGSYHVVAEAAGYARAHARADVPAATPLVVELAQASFIEGNVTTSDGKPAAGAEVTALGGPDPATAIASQTGAFSLEVAPRAWNVIAKLGQEAGRAPDLITVAPGATARGVKIQLEAGAQIAGLVLAATTQVPIGGAQIALAPHGVPGLSGSATSDAAGTFVLGGLAQGSYDVVISAAGFTTDTVSGVTVEPGQKFPLRALLHQTGTLQGIVSDSAGRAVAYALVQTLQGFAGPGVQPPAQQEARADETGAYLLSGLSAGHATFSALRDGSTLGTTASADIPEGGGAHLDFQLHDEGALIGHVRRADGTPAPAGTAVRAVPADNRASRADWGAIPVDATGAYVASLPSGPYMLSAGAAGGPPFGGGGARSFVQVDAGKTTTFDLQYTDASDPNAGFGGTVLEPGGAPSVGARLSISGGGRGGGGGFAVSDESGRFNFSRARSDLPETFSVTGVNGGRTGTAAVGAGQNDVVVQLQPGAVINGHLSSPAEQFKVTMTPAQFQFGGPGAGQALTFTGDRFTLRDVPAMQVQVTVTADDGRSASAQASPPAGGAVDVEIALQPISSVSGRLVDAVTQQPVANVTVMVDQGNVAQSAADGSFSLQLPAGTHSLRSFGGGYRGLAQDFTTQAGQPLSLGNLALTRQTAASGTIGAQLRGSPPIVTSLIAQGPAALAGLQIGDQLVSVDGQPAPTPQVATTLITGTPGTTVTLIVSRSGTQLTVPVQRAP